MEHGFFHPERGYWQAIDVSKDVYTVEVEPERTEIDEDGKETIIPAVMRETSQFDELLASYPPGTIEVPLKPGADYEWQDDAWIYVAPEAAPLPPLTARQLRLGLIGAGISLASVESAIAAIPDDTDRAVAQVEWEYASQFERDHPLIEQVGSALGLSSQQIDAAWTAAVDL